MAATSSFRQRGRHEHHLEPCSPGIASRRYSHSDRAPVAELHRRRLLDRRRSTWTVRGHSSEVNPRHDTLHADPRRRVDAAQALLTPMPWRRPLSASRRNVRATRTDQLQSDRAVLPVRKDLPPSVRHRTEGLTGGGDNGRNDPHSPWRGVAGSKAATRGEAK